MIFNDDPNWLGPMVLFGLLYATVWILAYTIPFIFKHLVIAPYRRTVRYSRVLGLNQTDAMSSEIMTHHGYITELDLRLPNGRSWRGLIVQNSIMVALIVVSSILILVSATSLIGSCSVLIGTEGFASGSAFFITFISSTALAVGLLCPILPLWQ